MQKNRNSMNNLQKPKYSKSSYKLSNLGYEKIKNVLEKKFSCAINQITYTAIKAETGIDRETIAKIITRTKGVNLATLENLFEALGEQLQHQDYQKFDRPVSPVQQKIPQSSSSSELFLVTKDIEKVTAILRELNYTSQKQLFEDVLHLNIIAATFLIHGKENYGQRWLANILRYRIPHYTSAWQHSIFIKPHRKNIETIWQNFAQKLDTSDSPAAIIEELYKHCQKKTIIIAIHDVDLIAGNCLKQFIDELWLPLFHKVNDTSSEEDLLKLVLFLIDNKNSKPQIEKNVNFIQKADKFQLHNFLVFKELESFRRREAKIWVGQQKELLLPLWKNSETIEYMIDRIVERDSQPISVLTDICSCFDFHWYNDVESKLAL